MKKEFRHTHTHTMGNLSLIIKFKIEEKKRNDWI